MSKRIILFLLVFCIFMPVYSEPSEQQIHVGTPPGFYDDIDPNSLDEEENGFPGMPSSEDGANEQNDNSENNEEDFFKDELMIFPSPQNLPTKDYAQIYNNLETPTFSYLHDIDPDQYYDMKDSSWSVYPLLRLISPIYFKNITIEPGYYLLTPREHKGEWYMLFKQNGVVKHIIPVYDRDYTPETFYDQHIPKPKLTKAQKVHMGTLSLIGKMDSSKRKDPIQNYLEVNDLDNYFVSIIIYYGPHKYSTIFRTIRL